MFYVYVLQSLKDGLLYTGVANNLGERLKEHNLWRVKSTKDRVPVKLIYYEACRNRDDALRRERYLKTSYGKRYLRNRLKNYFTG